MHDVSAHAAVHHGPPTSFIRKHIFSLDHKVIGKQYYGLALAAVIIGMMLSWLMTMHATFMVFFVLTTAPFAAFGNFFLPLHTGAEDMPFPHFNMMSFWTTFVAFCVMVSSFFVGDGPTLGGWTQYAPLSAVGSVAGPGQGTGVILWATSIAIFCIGQLFGALNFIPNVLDLRCKGMSMWRLPMPTWAWFITSCMGLTAFSVLMPACVMLILDHVG